MGALLIARREKDEKAQKALRNAKWFLGTGLGGLLAWYVVHWGTGYVDRIQAAAEARDSAFVTAMSEMAEKLSSVATETQGLGSKIESFRSLAIGAKRLPDCPPCVCPKCPSVSCPPGSPVIVQFPSDRSEVKRPEPKHPDAKPPTRFEDRNR